MRAAAGHPGKLTLSRLRLKCHQMRSLLQAALASSHVIQTLVETPPTVSAAAGHFGKLTLSKVQIDVGRSMASCHPANLSNEKRTSEITLANLYLHVRTSIHNNTTHIHIIHQQKQGKATTNKQARGTTKYRLDKYNVQAGKSTKQQADGHRQQTRTKTNEFN